VRQTAYCISDVLTVHRERSDSRFPNITNDHLNLSPLPRVEQVAPRGTPRANERRRIDAAAVLEAAGACGGLPRVVFGTSGAFQ
jgi:hypothetical protein